MVSGRICINHKKVVFLQYYDYSFCYRSFLNHHQLLIQAQQEPFASDILERKTSKLIFAVVIMCAVCFKNYLLIFSGWVEEGNILDYQTNRETFAQKYKLAGIKKAIIEIDEFIQSSQVSKIPINITNLQ